MYVKLLYMKNNSKGRGSVNLFLNNLNNKYKYIYSLLQQ